MLARLVAIFLLAIAAFPFPAHAAIDCPPGAVETYDVTVGTVCRYLKTGVKTVAPDDSGGCPDGYRLQSYRGESPGCFSMATDASRAGSEAMPTMPKCDPGMAPIFTSNGDMQCRRNFAMQSTELFRGASDCPTGTSFAVINLIGGCRPR